tara:strand:+ start:388 stop:672 length:285 start_codon:yes stop_codon:yes gene_type:complete
MDIKSKLTSCSISAVGGYKPPYNEMFKGVIKTAHTLAIAVIQTDKAVFPLAKEVMKLEMFPPGQAATIIIPIATLGMGLKIHTMKKVNKGKAIN